MFVNYGSKIEEFFSGNSKRMVFLGHMLSATPHPIITYIGLLIAGLGWLSSKTKFRYLTGPALIVLGLLLGSGTTCIWFAGLEEVGFNSLSHLSSTLLPLGVTVFVVAIVAYGLLALSLIDLGMRCSVTLLKYAAILFVLLIMMALFATSMLAYSVTQSSLPNLLSLQTLLTVFEGLVLSIVLMNFLGNILVSISFIKERVKLISPHLKKSQLGGDMKVRIKWLGHAAFMLTFKGKRVLIDPWISNPLSPVSVEELERVDYIIVTHDHFDHLGDAERIAKKFNSTVIGVPELVTSLERRGVQGLGLNMGAFVDVNGVFKVALVPALHTCSAGGPVGVILDVDGLRIYHMGDTGYTAEFQAIKEVFNPEVVLVPIGGHYTMGPREAALALKVLAPKVAIPMHYATFPVLVKTADDFVEKAKTLAPNVKVLVLKPGEEVEVP
ncbi:MAG: metal-dependent hydrolase [Candidatus Nezhaarchaeales archaeon]